MRSDVPPNVIALQLNRRKHLESVLGFTKFAEIQARMAARLREIELVDTVYSISPGMLGILATCRTADDALALARTCVERLAERMATVPVNQLMMQKLVVNQAIEAMGLKQTQMFATVFDGITRHSPEGLNFKARAESQGWKQAVRERDLGTFDWTENRPVNPRGGG